MAVINAGGGGMEPPAPIVVIDSGVVAGGDGGKEPTASIIVVDGGDGNDLDDYVGVCDQVCW